MPTPTANANIVAQAFRFMEVTPPSSLADDTDKAAAANEQYPVALRICLEAADFSFASVLENLPLYTLPAPYAADAALPYTYKLPGQLVRLHEVGDEATKWRLDAIALRADAAAPLRIRYTAMVTNEDSLPATFQTAVALQLAVLLSPVWLTTGSKIEAIHQQLRIAMTEAKRQDARMASAARYDGLDDQPDWAAEARY